MVKRTTRLRKQPANNVASNTTLKGFVVYKSPVSYLVTIMRDVDTAPSTNRTGTKRKRNVQSCTTSKDHKDLKIKIKTNVIIQEEDGKMWETSDTNLANLKMPCLSLNCQHDVHRKPKPRKLKLKQQRLRMSNDLKLRYQRLRKSIQL